MIDGGGGNCSRSATQASLKLGMQPTPAAGTGISLHHLVPWRHRHLREVHHAAPRHIAFASRLPLAGLDPTRQIPSPHMRLLHDCTSHATRPDSEPAGERAVSSHGDVRREISILRRLSTSLALGHSINPASFSSRSDRRHHGRQLSLLETAGGLKVSPSSSLPHPRNIAHCDLLETEGRQW